MRFLQNIQMAGIVIKNLIIFSDQENKILTIFKMMNRKLINRQIRRSSAIRVIKKKLHLTKVNFLNGIPKQMLNLDFMICLNLKILIKRIVLIKSKAVLLIKIKSTQIQHLSKIQDNSRILKMNNKIIKGIKNLKIMISMNNMKRMS